VSFTIAAVLEIPRVDDYNKFRRWHHPTRTSECTLPCTA